MMDNDQNNLVILSAKYVRANRKAGSLAKKEQVVTRISNKYTYGIPVGSARSSC
jgi:hypothetical protein